MSEEFDFAVEAQKTASPFFHTEKVPASNLYVAIREAAAALARLDLMRKAIFYENRQYELPIGGVPGVFQREYPNLNPHLIHGILGSACEGGEKLDLLVRTFDGEEFDRVNYIEECGDGLWFDQIGLTVIGGVTTREAEIVAIKKIRARSGESFNKQGFNERDLLTERSVLEQATTPVAKGEKVRVSKDDG